MCGMEPHILMHGYGSLHKGEWQLHGSSGSQGWMMQRVVMVHCSESEKSQDKLYHQTGWIRIGVRTNRKQISPVLSSFLLTWSCHFLFPESIWAGSRKGYRLMIAPFSISHSDLSYHGNLMKHSAPGPRWGHGGVVVALGMCIIVHGSFFSSQLMCTLFPTQKYLAPQDR